MNIEDALHDFKLPTKQLQNNLQNIFIFMKF
jgi:hypothetical protein